MSTDFELEMDISGDDIDRDGRGGLFVAPGSYTFVCTNVVMHTERSGDFEFELEVLAGTDPTQIGRHHHEYLKYPTADLDDAAKAIRRRIFREVAYALGCTTKEDLKAQDKSRAKIDFSKAIGAFCKGTLADDTYEGKFKSSFFKKGSRSGIWRPDDPKAAGIPAPGDPTPAASQAGTTETSPAVNQKATTPPAPQGDDLFGGIV